MAVVRGLPAGVLAHLFAPQVAQFYAALIEVSGGGLSSTLRYCTGFEPCTYGGDVYTAAAFDVVLPPEAGDRPPQARLVVDNVSRLFTDLVNEASTPVDVVLRVVEKDDPPVLLQEYFLAAYVASYGAQVGEAPLQGPPVLDEILPQWRYVPLWFAGIFVD